MMTVLKSKSLKLYCFSCLFMCSRHCFIALHFTKFYRFCVFCKLKICVNFALSKSIYGIFSTPFAHFMSLCNTLVTFTMFPTFLLLYTLWWSMITFEHHYCKMIMTHWMLRWWYISRYIPCVFNIMLWCTSSTTVWWKHNSCMHWETKASVWLASWKVLLYCDGLEPDFQYLWGMPI